MKDSAQVLQNQQIGTIQNDTKEISQLVLAAESGDLEFFCKQIQKGHTTAALVLAFIYAIYGEKINILQFYFSAGYIKQISIYLYKDPLITAATKDSIKSFQFLLRQGLHLPDDILGPVFHNNAKSIIRYIIDDDILSRQILEKRFETAWALRALDKKDNESVRIFKNFLTKE